MNKVFKREIHILSTTKVTIRMKSDYHKLKLCSIFQTSNSK